jgi:hypothetical protein
VYGINILRAGKVEPYEMETRLEDVYNDAIRCENESARFGWRYNGVNSPGEMICKITSLDNKVLYRRGIPEELIKPPEPRFIC